jgi:hypothetical protein
MFHQGFQKSKPAVVKAANHCNTRQEEVFPSVPEDGQLF